MTEYIRQLTEQGLVKLGKVMNTLNNIAELNEADAQHRIAVCALDIEDVLKNHIISLDYEVKL